MKISYAPYTLVARTRLNAVTPQRERYGALLRVEGASYQVGYADCFAWPELGDLPLDQQLSSLRDNVLTPLTARALENAELDGQARTERRSLWAGLRVPESHYLVLDYQLLQETELQDLWERGFRALKLKLDRSLLQDSRDLQRFFEMCDSQWSIRIDANQIFTAREATDLSTLFTEVEFWEDPCPYTSVEWSSLQTQVTLALDRVPIGQDWQNLYTAQAPGFAVFIHKPALQETRQIAAAQRRPVVVTSYLDHPVGQCFAAYHAAQLASVGLCGLQTHHVYEPSAFSEILGGRVSAAFQVPSGSGIGFNELLEQQAWRPLS
jgi:O-succinylbenzoate synthase